MLRSEIPRKHKGVVCIDAIADITERKDECGYCNASEITSV